ncbi:uncharacterized protein CTRU02_209914 [Colletotrichum truncatum]|uniref:Uncharacterized protein n=1 Tax=Colletotrichum truncatum TaxID=5467 RepID=A0ACC3YTV1_COLTU
MSIHDSAVAYNKRAGSSWSKVCPGSGPVMQVVPRGELPKTRTTDASLIDIRFIWG